MTPRCNFQCNRHLRFMGLALKRFSEWKAVLAEEENIMTWRTWLHMAKEALNATFRPIGAVRFRKRIRICAKCPVYDSGLRRCRPYTGAKVGCGCYVPYKAQGREACWARQRNPNMGWE